MPRVIAVLVALAATIAAAVECAQTPSPRAMPRWAWLIVIILVPVIGPIAWFLAGRQRQGAVPRRSSGPDDDPRFMREIGDQVWLQRRSRPKPPPTPET